MEIQLKHKGEYRRFFVISAILLSLVILLSVVVISDTVIASEDDESPIYGPSAGNITVDLHGNGGSLSEDSIKSFYWASGNGRYIYTYTLTESNIPHRTGYEFVGYTFEQNNLATLVPSFIGENNIYYNTDEPEGEPFKGLSGGDMYAYWVPEGNLVTIEPGNEGPYYIDQSTLVMLYCDDGEALGTLPDWMTGHGTTYESRKVDTTWFYDPVGIFAYGSPTSEGTFIISHDGVDYQIIVTAPHDVTFMSNGSIYTTSTVQYGSTVQQPSDPTYANHTFLGWYTSESGGTLFDFDTPITSDTTLYAHWQIVSHTVTFISNGVTVSTQVIEHGGKASIPTQPVLEGYTFKGWSSTVQTPGTITGSVFDFNTAINADTTLYAMWEGNLHFTSDPSAAMNVTKSADGTYIFDASPSQDYTTVLWDFGDGNTSTNLTEAHYYSEPGTYTVKLTVYNDYGSDTMDYEITVTENGATGGGKMTSHGSYSWRSSSSSSSQGLWYSDSFCDDHVVMGVSA